MSACQSQGAMPAHRRRAPPRPCPRRASSRLAEGAEPITISDTVVDKVAELLAEEGDPSLQLRIFVTGGGCSGFQYGFAFDDERKDDDLRIDRGADHTWWSTR